MIRDDAPLRFLGIDGSTGRPLAPMPVQQARHRAKEALLGIKPLRYGMASGDLRSAGWGVVFTEDVRTDVRDALGPLLTRRQDQAGDRYHELTYKTGEPTADFRTRLRGQLGRVDPRQIPWYLLLVGDPANLPYGFEFDLGIPHAVGRLAFENTKDFAAYAERLIDAEKALPNRKSRAAIFAPAHPDDPPTRASTDHLARPLANLLEQRGVDVTRALGDLASRTRLGEMLADDHDLLIAAGHSSVFPLDHEAQRDRQGALICAEWPGPSQWPKAIPARHTFSAAELPTGALRQGIAILFGCHTAGTPQLDIYDGDQPKDARPAASRPFISALAQRLLGREGGALAVLGHVGRTFEASFLWRGVRQTGAFEDTLNALLDGCRLGEAVDGFGQRFADLAALWASSMMSPNGNKLDPLDLWIAFHDARSWSLIGDPAVRLPVASRQVDG